jgi:hypothetical protein
MFMIRSPDLWRLKAVSQAVGRQRSAAITITCTPASSSEQQLFSSFGKHWLGDISDCSDKLTKTH